MPTTPNLQLGTTYNFELVQNPVIQSTCKGALVVGLMNYEQAEKEIDARALHVTLFPLLPSGTPDDPKAYNYVKVKFPAGFVTVYGLPWIKANTVTEVTSQTIRVMIGEVTAGDATAIRQALTHNGFNVLSIEVLQQ